MLLEALFKLLGWILFPFGIAIILGAWLGYLGFWGDAGVNWLDFISGSLFWAILFTLVGGFTSALGKVLVQS